MKKITKSLLCTLFFVYTFEGNASSSAPCDETIQYRENPLVCENAQDPSDLINYHVSINCNLKNTYNRLIKIKNSKTLSESDKTALENNARVILVNHIILNRLISQEIDPDFLRAALRSAKNKMSEINNFADTLTANNN